MASQLQPVALAIISSCYIYICTCTYTHYCVFWHSDGVEAQSQFNLIPSSVVVYLNDEQVHFTCGTWEHGLLSWVVDSIEARLPEIQNRGVSYINSAGISTLSISASLHNNNSELVCVLSDPSTGGVIARTLSAYLIVQGESRSNGYYSHLICLRTLAFIMQIEVYNKSILHGIVLWLHFCQLQ